MDNKELVKQFEYLARSIYTITYLATNACLPEQKLNPYGIKSMYGSLSNLMYVLRDYLPYKSNDFKELFKELNFKNILGDYPYYFSSLIDRIEKETLNIDRFLGGIEREIEKGDYNIDRFELDVASEDLSDYWSFSSVMSSYGIDRNRYNYEIFNDDTLKDKPALKGVQLSYLEVGEKLESNALTLKSSEYITKDFPNISKIKDPKVVSKVIKREEKYKSIYNRDGYYYKHPEQYGKQIKSNNIEKTEDTVIIKGGKMELNEQLKKICGKYTELLTLGYVMTLSDNKDRTKLVKDYIDGDLMIAWTNLVYSAESVYPFDNTIKDTILNKEANPYFNIEFSRKVTNSQQADNYCMKLIKEISNLVIEMKQNLRYMKDTMSRNGKPLIDYDDMEDSIDIFFDVWDDKETFQFCYYAWKSKSGVELGFDGYTNVFYADKFIDELKKGKSLYKIYKEANKKRVEVEQFCKDLGYGKYLPCLAVKAKDMYISSEEFIRDNADELITNLSKYAVELDKIVFIPSLTRELKTVEDLAEAYRVGIKDKNYGNYIKNIFLQLYRNKALNTSKDLTDYYTEKQSDKIMKSIKNNTSGSRITQKTVDKIGKEILTVVK